MVSSQYQVQSGDSGSSIASKLGISFSVLEAANLGVDWNNLQVSEVLYTSSQTMTYKVNSGDTGTAIARRFNIGFSELEAANLGVNWNSLQLGQTLQIPSSRSSLPPASSGGQIRLSDGTDGDSTVRRYSGPASNFPSPSQWQKFGSMWVADAQIMAAHDTPQQIEFIKEAILTVSNKSGIDPRVILSVIMQESHGNVHIPTTASPPPDNIRNPGIMQTHNGSEFDESDQAGSILQMVRDGIEGTPTGDGIKQCLARQGNIYAALREYNSGSVNSNDLSSGVGTPSYVSDIANRLLGAQPN